MGDLKVIRLSTKEDKSNYIHQLVKDIDALDKMIEDGLIEKTPIRIGAEQEFCLINNDFKASHNSLEILKEINDDHFTTEIGNYNLEINLEVLLPLFLHFSPVLKGCKSLPAHYKHTKN